MKKTFVTCMVLVALFAVANSASAVTCTVDQRPAATLLVPWFQVTFNPDGSPQTATSPLGQAALDTIVTIGNASSAPMIAHLSVFNERSFMVLDFNVALTGFDVQAMRMSEVLRGNLPSTPITKLHQSVVPGAPCLLTATCVGDVCQRNSLAAVYPNPDGFLRVRPTNPTTPQDNTLATALYPVPAFQQGGSFQLDTLDSLDATPDSEGCELVVPFPPDHVISGLIRGYMTVDMVNYCNLSNPSDARYYLADGIGNENNLFGEVIYTSSTGIPTYGASTVNIESDRSFSNTLNGGQFDQTATARTRTFYARYWDPTTEQFCTNCVGTLAQGTNLALNAPWDQGFGDEREPLGLKYAARYFEGGGVTSNWIVWRASAKAGAIVLADLTGDQLVAQNGKCTAVEPLPAITFFDEDENTIVTILTPGPSGGLPQAPQTINIPLETQRISPSIFPRPSGAVAGWASLEFRNLATGTVLDQAWMSYEFIGAAALLAAAAPATQLDPSTCNPLGVPIGAFPAGVNGPVAPVIPGGITGLSGSGPAGTGPTQ